MTGTGAERQARLREKRLNDGLTQVAVWLPREHSAEFIHAAEKIRGNPELSIVLKNTRTGRYVKNGH